MVENNQNTSSSNQNTTANTATSGIPNQGLQGSGQQQLNVNPQAGYQQGYQQQGLAQNQYAYQSKPNLNNYQQGQQGLGQQYVYANNQNNQLGVPELNQGLGGGQQQDDLLTADQRTRYNEMIQKVSAKKMTDLAPALDTYIKADLEEKAVLNNYNKTLVEENKMLRSEIQRWANITLLSKHGFNTHDYDVVVKLCDYVVTEEKLIDIAKDWRFQNLRNKRAEQKAVTPDEKAAGLFDEIMGVKRT